MCLLRQRPKLLSLPYIVTHTHPHTQSHSHPPHLFVCVFISTCLHRFRSFFSFFPFPGSYCCTHSSTHFHTHTHTHSPSPVCVCVRVYVSLPFPFSSTPHLRYHFLALRRLGVCVCVCVDGSSPPFHALASVSLSSPPLLLCRPLLVLPLTLLPIQFPRCHPLRFLPLPEGELFS